MQPVLSADYLCITKTHASHLSVVVDWISLAGVLKETDDCRFAFELRQLGQDLPQHSLRYCNFFFVSRIPINHHRDR